MSLAPEEKYRRLERALAYGGPTHTPADIVALVKSGRAQYWEEGDGCIVTELNDYPLFRAVRYWLIFGSLADCLGLENRINDWAVREGCSVAIATGRRGWGRAAAPTGWMEQPHAHNFFKPLLKGH